MTIYAQYGYSLPHSSSAQSGCGRSVSLSDVQPGDLIFYKHGGSIGHVAIYIGGGRVVHAQSARTGITTSSMYYNQPACARRIVG
jgi:cell wall-associated NlpC family hydrolase